MYEIGKLYRWRGLVGRFAYLNGSECTVTGPRCAFGWPTDTPPPTVAYATSYAAPGNLVPVDPPSGERSVLELFVRDDDLTPAEANELALVWYAWNNARARRDYVSADPLRAQLMEWGATGAALDRWHPVFESTAHREARLGRR